MSQKSVEVSQGANAQSSSTVSAAAGSVQQRNTGTVVPPIPTASAAAAVILAENERLKIRVAHLCGQVDAYIALAEKYRTMLTKAESELFVQNYWNYWKEAAPEYYAQHAHHAQWRPPRQHARR